MIKEGEELAMQFTPNIVVKNSYMIKDGIKALKYFTDKGIKITVLYFFSAGQALCCKSWCYPRFTFFRKIEDDVSTDGLALIEEIRIIFLITTITN